MLLISLVSLKYVNLYLGSKRDYPIESMRANIGASFGGNAQFLIPNRAASQNNWFTGTLEDRLSEKWEFGQSGTLRMGQVRPFFIPFLASHLHHVSRVPGQGCGVFLPFRRSLWNRRGTCYDIRMIARALCIFCL